MKDLTDYFSSPAKTPEVPELKTVCSGSVLNTEDTVNLKGAECVKKRKKKKTTQKFSDPAIKNSAHLLSNSLTIVSPNGSFNNQLETPESSRKHEVVIVKQSDSSVTAVEDETSRNNESNINSGNKTDNCLTPRNKLNAFQFLMDSRNRVIGQNLTGKERSEDDVTTDEERDSKKVLTARKSLLKNWADKKGAIKRKREEEEKEEVINHKLEKRAKRLKKLLKANTGEGENDSTRKKKRRVKQISTSSSDNTKDSVVCWNSRDTTENNVLEVIEENAQDRVLHEPKTNKTKQGLLTFFGVVNEAKVSESVDKNNGSLTEKEMIKIKLNISKSKKKKCKTEKTVNESSDVIVGDSCSVEHIVVKKKKSKKHKKYVDKTSLDYLSAGGKTLKTPKRKPKDEADGNFTPNSLKSWKMRIKINNESLEKEQEENIEQKPPQRTTAKRNYVMVSSDETSNDGKGKVLRQRKLKSKAYDSNQIVLSSDDESASQKIPKPVKVAPVFAKASPKPKIAPEVVEARKQFLMSGIPDSLKKTIEKQQSMEQREYDIFPTISHVQQKHKTEKFWNLPDPQLNFKLHSPLKIRKPIPCAGLSNSHVTSTLNIQKEVEKVDKLKTLLNKIKSDNANYPVYKSFRLIHEKSGKSLKKTEPTTKRKKHKRRSKSADSSIEIIEDPKPDTDQADHSTWTDRYKPRCSEDIIGNADGVKRLKNWLVYWKNFSEEINAKRKRREGYTSESDFDTTDGDSRDSCKMPGNTMVVGGPCGSGKSSAIYAICGELGFNVIELNASSKRSGKRLLQELQEATQSHQVRKKEQNMQHFVHSKKSKEKAQTVDRTKKMCVLLVEDIDIVFEQDDGFVSALSQLISTSKRPVVLTTTDSSSVFAQKFISQYEYLPFLPLSSQSLATWLQIVCLVEGLFVNPTDIGGLLEFNRGDVRKTLLHLQFWVQSGGQIVREDCAVKIVGPSLSKGEKSVTDEEEPKLKEDSHCAKETFTHSGCFRSFQVYEHHKPYRVPYYVNLGLLWWNIPNLLGMPSFAKKRVKKLKENYVEASASKETEVAAATSVERRKLNALWKLYDSMAFTDVSFRTLQHFDGLEPTVKNYSNGLGDSLEVQENLDGYDGHGDFIHNVTHSLVDGYLDEYIRIERNESVFNIGAPVKSERRWRGKMHLCEDVLLEAVPLSSYIERRSIALDYMPCLRNISRSEARRAANNTKRCNRFRNYLRGLGINYKDNTLKLACNILTADDM